jgi:hypothetical protein
MFFPDFEVQMFFYNFCCEIEAPYLFAEPSSSGKPAIIMFCLYTSSEGSKYSWTGVKPVSETF